MSPRKGLPVSRIVGRRRAAPDDPVSGSFLMFLFREVLSLVRLRPGDGQLPGGFDRSLINPETRWQISFELAPIADCG